MSRAPKTILVSGANRGIGKETVRQLAAQGHQLILGSRKLERGQAAAAALSGDITAIELDVADPRSIAEAVATVQSRFGKLDVLINNAGMYSDHLSAGEVDLDAARQVLETNFWGAWKLTQECLPLLRKAGGRVLNISSGMGQWSSLQGGYAAYRLSKTALNALTQLMANEERGLRFAAIDPGWVQTDMGGASAPRSVGEGADTPVWLATVAEFPSGKFWRDREVVAW